MVVQHRVEGYDNFCTFLNSFDTKSKNVYVYFGGSKLSNGESWCDDCQKAWPFIDKELAKLDNNHHLIYVEVGDRETWKDPNCSFRKDKRTNLLVIPTLIRWNGPQRLTGEQCEKPELLSMFFEDDD